MVGLDEIGVSGQGFEGSRAVLCQLGNQIVFKRLDMGEALPGELASQVLPDALGRIELGASRWLEQQPNVLGYP